MKIVKCDLLKFAEQSEFDVIIHGCNCFCAMGAGIARTIRREYPAAYQADCKTEKGSKTKLGTYSSAKVHSSGYCFEIVNAYTQYRAKGFFRWWGRGVLVDYDAINSVMSLIKSDFSGCRIGYPLIGSGLAGGDWQTILKNY